MNIIVIDDSKNLISEFARIASSINVSPVLVAEKYQQQKNQSVTVSTESVSTERLDNLILINEQQLIIATARRATVDEQNLHLEIKDDKQVSKRTTSKIKHDWQSQKNRIPKYAKSRL